MLPPGDASASPCYTCFQAIEDVLTQGIRQLNFKNDAFATSITPTSSVTDCVDILCSSSLLLPPEKEILQECVEQYTELCNMPSTERAGFAQLFEFMTSVNAMWEIFKADAVSRGLDVAPTYFERVFAGLRQKVTDSHFPTRNQEDDHTDFGAEFGRNLRSGFM